MLRTKGSIRDDPSNDLTLTSNNLTLTHCPKLLGSHVVEKEKMAKMEGSTTTFPHDDSEYSCPNGLTPLGHHGPKPKEHCPASVWHGTPAVPVPSPARVVPVPGQRLRPAVPVRARHEKWVGTTRSGCFLSLDAFA